MATHGISYDLSSYEQIPGESLRKLSATAFSQLHLDHLLSHPPDQVLFPFLHGLEGDNEAQNMFFATSGQNITVPKTGKKQSVAPVPKYRGLMWVICDEDMQPSQLALLSKPSERFNYSDDDYDFDDSEDDELIDDDEDFVDDFGGNESSNSSFEEPSSSGTDMDVDIEVVDNDRDTAPDSLHSHDVLEIVGIGTDDKHMHPVQHRAIPIVKPIQTDNLPKPTSPTSSAASSEAPYSFFESPDSSSITSPASSKSTSPYPLALKPETANVNHTSSLTTPTKHLTDRRRRQSTPPPILTSTFRAKDLIRAVPGTGDRGDGEWEFLPVRVPDGISLRNFGIQVSVLATLSDIIIYSPTPQGAAQSPKAIRLARQFQNAIERTRKERIARLGLDENGAKPTMDGTLADEELLRYNVFILDAPAEELGTTLSHMVMRMCPSGEVPGSLGPGGNSAAISKPSTSMQDDFAMDMDLDTQPLRSVHGTLKANSVDFAQRERDEMRDLTKASEIISVSRDGAPSPTGHHRGSSSDSIDFTSLPDLSTTATHFDPLIGQVFLGNSNDVPLPSVGENEPNLGVETNGLCHPLNGSLSSSIPNEGFNHAMDHYPPPPLPLSHPLNFEGSNDPEHGYGYDICVECHDSAPFPNENNLKVAEEKIAWLEALWAERCDQPHDGILPPRPPPHANSIIHLPFPSSPPATPANMNALMPVLRFLQSCITAPQAQTIPQESSTHQEDSGLTGRRWSAVASTLMSTAFSTQTSRNRSYTSPTQFRPTYGSNARAWSRPLKILIYSSDGYTESSVLALCLLMNIKGLTLPEAYLQLQVVKRRSFFVYQADLGILRRVETEERREREREMQMQQERARERERVTRERSGSTGARRTPGSSPGFNPYATAGWTPAENNGKSVRPPLPSSTRNYSPSDGQKLPGRRPAAKSVSFAQAPVLTFQSAEAHVSEPPPEPITTPPPHSTVPLSSSVPDITTSTAVKARRPRAMTSPWLPSSFDGDHQAWFNDSRFDGSFPSRVLPFLYLGNLAHASNAYMLHALGITHVVSVGECALIPPPNMQSFLNQHQDTSFTYPRCSASQFIPGRGPGNQGSLWIEERAGRIKVLDIQGVCDDGIDTLEPQLDPICEWIDKARQEGGQVLVHCRVGVSRSATVTIAYVMKHLGLSLVDAYLIVRSRRLSVLIQPNMRLLYNLCGWEIKLAKDRAGDDPKELQRELSTALSWPYLAKEVHALNEKYLH